MIKSKFIAEIITNFKYHPEEKKAVHRSGLLVYKNDSKPIYIAHLYYQLFIFNVLQILN